jgi:hypothetical protein
MTHPPELTQERFLLYLLTLQVRCKTGSVSNNGRSLRVSDLVYGRPYNVKDNFGRDFPGGVVLLWVYGTVSSCQQPELPHTYSLCQTALQQQTVAQTVT